jgi:hypothetical protein
LRLVVLGLRIGAARAGGEKIVVGWERKWKWKRKRKIEPVLDPISATNLGSD